MAKTSAHSQEQQNDHCLLYNLPQYYDVAFSWDITREILSLQRCLNHAAIQTKHLLEPACGSGRFLVSLARRGYSLVGYDNNPSMVEYATKRIKEEDLEDRVRVVLADMRSARFGEEFDAGFNMINSLGYLLTDQDVGSHLCNTAESIRRGGLYVVHLNCASEMFRPQIGEEWVTEREGVSIRTTWRVVREDRENRLSHQLCRMEISDQGEKRVLEEKHVMRLWLFEDLQGMAQDSGLVVEAIYDEKGRSVPTDSSIVGEMGNLYVVLKVIE